MISKYSKIKFDLLIYFETFINTYYNSRVQNYNIPQKIT